MTLAADYCPQRAEGFAFAALMSVLNLASTLSENLGSLLYQHVFHGRLNPLIVLSAGSFGQVVRITPPLVTTAAEADQAVEVGDGELFRRVVKAAFAQRRKTLWNCLRGAAVAAGQAEWAGAADRGRDTGGGGAARPPTGRRR